ncbi:MAG: hypothetical protein ACREEP_17280 [Dongiaceae bacterium]
MSPLRIVGFGLVGFACLFGVANAWYWLIDAASGGISLYDIWNRFAPASLNVVESFIVRYVWATLWSGMFIILAQPAWIVLGIVGLLCIGLGRKKLEE